MGINSSAYFRALSEGRDELLPAEWVSEYLGTEFSKVTTMEGLLLRPIMESSGSDGLWFSPLSSPSFGLQKEKAFVLLIYSTDICWVPTLAARSLLLRAMGGCTAAGRVLPGGCPSRAWTTETHPGIATIQEIKAFWSRAKSSREQSKRGAFQIRWPGRA